MMVLSGQSFLKSSVNTQIIPLKSKMHLGLSPVLQSRTRGLKLVLTGKVQ